MNIFNPEHDLCLANGDPNFVPPESALRFGRECAGLNSWIETGDGIIPWGWDAVLKRRQAEIIVEMEALRAEQADIRHIVRRHERSV